MHIIAISFPPGGRSTNGASLHSSPFREALKNTKTRCPTGLETKNRCQLPGRQADRSGVRSARACPESGIVECPLAYGVLHPVYSLGFTQSHRHDLRHVRLLVLARTLSWRTGTFTPGTVQLCSYSSSCGWPSNGTSRCGWSWFA